MAHPARRPGGADDRGALRPRGDAFGQAGDERHAQEVLIVVNGLGDQPVPAQEVAVVGREHHQGVVRQAVTIEAIQNPPDLLIHVV